MSKTCVAVQLPNPVPEISVPPCLALPLQALIAAGERGATTPVLQWAGCLHSAHAVSKLHKLREIIETQRCGAHDSQGEIHKGVARYVDKGWEPAAVSSDSFCNQKETS